MDMTHEALRRRLLSHIEHAANGCWIWLRAKRPEGYGTLDAAVEGKKYQTHAAHRVSYIVFRGPIPSGLEIDHLCRQPSCINPDHLEVVTRRENVLRSRSFAAINSRKKSCKSGHPLSGENLYLRPNGARVCRTCQREFRLKSKARARAARATAKDRVETR